MKKIYGILIFMATVLFWGVFHVNCSYADTGSYPDMPFGLDEEKFIPQFHQEGNYTYYILDEAKKEISISKVANVKNQLVIPTEIDGYKVTGLGMLYDTFYIYEEEGYPVDEYRIVAKEDINKVKSIAIPEGVKYIGTNSFYGMRKLKDISFPNSLQSIQSDAFVSIDAEEIVLPVNLNYISNYSFRDCSSLKRVLIKSKELSFSDEYPAFKSCEALKEVILDGVEKMNMDGFNLNENADKLVISASVKEIVMLTCNFKQVIVKGTKTEFYWYDGYNYNWNKAAEIYVPKNAAAIRTLKKLKVNYKEVTLPSAPKVIKKTVSSGSSKRIKLSWNSQNGVTAYEVYYSKEKNGTYKRLKVTGKTHCYMAGQSGYIAVRAYKTLQKEKWCGEFTTIKLR